MNESQELTYWTEGEKRNLLSPDWEYFSQIKIPALALIDLLALSSELDHRFVHPTDGYSKTGWANKNEGRVGMPPRLVSNDATARR